MPSATAHPDQAPKLIRRPRTIRIGVVVPLTSLLGNNDAPGETADRSGFIPGETLRQHIAEAIHSNRRDQVLFTRLLTDNHGRLLDTTELGRYPSTRLAEAITIRAGTCRYPTCSVPADRCDLDHHEPVPKGTTSGRNMDPFCRRHHRGKTFTWHACTRDDNGIDWTMPDAEHYRCIDEPLPTGMAPLTNHCRSLRLPSALATPLTYLHLAALALVRYSFPVAHIGHDTSKCDLGANSSGCGM
jgi:hypothetical protein